MPFLLYLQSLFKGISGTYVDGFMLSISVLLSFKWNSLKNTNAYKYFCALQKTPHQFSVGLKMFLSFLRSGK